jgi:hypothetical protein
MKTIRNLTILVGLSVMVLVLGAAAVRGQVITMPRFAGSFTLPLDTAWGQMTLPAGEYRVYYGYSNHGGATLVNIVGKAKGSAHGTLIAGLMKDVSTKNDSLVCVRDGNTLVVRSLEMPEIGEAAEFSAPKGAKRLANNWKHKGYTELAEGPMLVQRIPVTLGTE